MTNLRCLLALVLATTLSGAAWADPIVPGDFAAVVIDPLPSPSEITLVLNPTFPVSLAPCQTDQLDGLSTSDFVGCFTGLNISGEAITSLTMEFPAIFLSGDQLDQANCPLESQNIFTSISCGFTDSTDSEYVLQFSGGDIPTLLTGPDCTQGLEPCVQDSLFTIAIGGIPFNSLPQNFDAVGNLTPEPGTLLLTATGAMSIGLFAAYRRRQILASPRR